MMNRKLRKRRLLLIVVSLAIVAGASFPFLMSASCLTRQQTPAEQNALISLRNMTRGNVLPAEDAVASLESQFPRTKVAALARMLRARIKLNAKDYAGAAQLLDASVIRDQSVIGDYALFMRASAFEQAGREKEAGATYLQLINDYPSSLRTRESALRVATFMSKNGDSAAIPLLLKDLVTADDAEALLATARAYEQTSNQAKALETYRRLYFFAPQSDLSADAAAALTKLSSSTSPGSIDEGIARADRLYNAKRFSDSYSAFTEAFNVFPATATPQNQLRRGIAAFNSRKFPEAVSALMTVPASAGETRAEAQLYLAQAYARQRQWQQALTQITSFAPPSLLTRTLLKWPRRSLISRGKLMKQKTSLSHREC
jgi:tetratricopeptide (TPR) repeat protein